MREQVIGFLFFLLLAACIAIFLRFNKRARLRRQRRQLTEAHKRLVDDKVRLTKGQKRFDCPRCLSAAPCKGCITGHPGRT